MNRPIVTASGALVCHCVRLRRGDDLLLSIRELAQEKHIAAGVVLSAVGCVTEAKVRDASGVNIRSIGEHCVYLQHFHPLTLSLKKPQKSLIPDRQG